MQALLILGLTGAGLLLAALAFERDRQAHAAGAAATAQGYAEEGGAQQLANAATGASWQTADWYTAGMTGSPPPDVWSPAAATNFAQNLTNLYAFGTPEAAIGTSSTGTANG